jgi:hypothetical protein
MFPHVIDLTLHSCYNQLTPTLRDRFIFPYIYLRQFVTYHDFTMRDNVDSATGTERRLSLVAFMFM